MAKGKHPVASYVAVTGNVGSSAISVGNHNNQVVTSGSDHKQLAELDTSLLAIRRILDDLSGPHADRARYGVDEVIEDAKKPKVDMNLLGNLLDKALNAAKKTSEFSTIAVNLAPHVKQVANWLGGEWSQLQTLI